MLRLFTPGIGHSVLRIAATSGILAGAFGLFQWGYLILTADALVKLILTFLYTHLHSEAKTTLTPKVAAGEPSSKLEELKEPLLTITGDNLSLNDGEPDVVGCVVGWREDEQLYARCLESLRSTRSCTTIIAGIDGDEEEDEQMIDVFHKVFPDGVVFRLSQPLSETLEHLATLSHVDMLNDEAGQAAITEQLRSYVSQLLAEELLPDHPRDIGAICVVQPHRSKKDILFTTLIIATILAEAHSTDLIFSTDSDSTVSPDAIPQMARKLNSDQNIGGVSGHMRFIHPKPTFITQVATSYYWFQQDVYKIQGAIFGTNECQPGPVGAFRASALVKVLIPWSCQRVLGRKMITNEDRHLTTRLLWAGYDVHHVPGATVYTDTPDSLSAWVRQQVRWSRGTMVESIWYPRMVWRLSPWHIFTILKSRLIPILTFCMVVSSAVTGQRFLGGILDRALADMVITVDVFCCFSLQVIYLVFLGPNDTLVQDIVWLVPALVWFLVLSPGIVVWSLITVLDGSWGTQPRAVSKKAAAGCTRSNFRQVSNEVLFVLSWLAVFFAVMFRDYYHQIMMMSTGTSM
ncbi:hypothetical protein DHEL01_v206257 [Diaporthe helianthi]|uniref:Glycosyltransferase 2-like domain-containing protein n=1 Tax=Diaporthe helianthi TaxID=158607 RepID=A0A2P5HYN3_DIAHE|nr:hypothetical protein DHEL01_v206257 [Diaporthe helianthi]